MKSKPIITTLIISFFLLFSCVSPKKFAILQDAKASSTTNDSNFEIKFQPDDIVFIYISTVDPLVSNPYNLIFKSNNGDKEFTYQIDSKGFVDLPNLGKILVAGKSREEVVLIIKELLKNKIENPFILVKLMNFKVTVQGEVNKPGVFQVESERITVFEALSMAGDLTIYGKRNNILLVRENNGIKSFIRLDITKGDFANSPYYYLSQNDLIYVEPNMIKTSSSAVGPALGVVFSIISLGITIFVLTTR